MQRIPKRFSSVGAALVMLVAGLAVPAVPATAATPAADTTTVQERKRVDSVPTPRLDWYPCPAGQCETVRLPIDYDRPHGATTEIAVVRIPARTPRARVGTLFIGPDTAGYSALGTLESALLPGRNWFGAAVLDRFDIVAFDSRGTAFSDNVSCFKTEREQLAALRGIPIDVPPVTARDGKALLASARALGAACAARGKPLAGAMSTAQTARDLDVLRRAVGEKKLTYLGAGYGSVLGQYYANMFPDRVRAVALDSVLDPRAWTGAGSAAGRPLYDRLGVVDARRTAVRGLLARCGPAGPEHCRMAVGGGDPVAKYDAMIARIKVKPIVLPPVDDLPANTFTYRDWLWIANYASFDGGLGGAILVDIAADLYQASAPASTPAAKRELARDYHGLRSRLGAARPVGFDYDNSVEAASAIICADGRHPAKSAQWPALVAAVEKRAPDFAPYAWASAQCANDMWKVRDKSAYTGPFNRRTSAPLLLTSARFGWLADYRGAVAVSRLLPGARLLPSTGWGRGAFGTSACMTGAVDAYLLSVALPAPGTECRADDQPYPDPAVPPTVRRR